MRTEFQVQRDDLPNHRLVETDEPALNGGEIRVRVDRFALTANNLTYGVAGDLLGYWQFFPPSDDAEDTWGIIPVWGFGDVVESARPEVPVGDRLYGYFPPATTVVMRPTRVDDGTFIDGTPHRQGLPPLYNRYRRALAEEGYDRAGDDATVLLEPLYLTAFTLAHRLSSQAYHDAEQVVIVSASSKTALGLAYALSQEPDAPAIIGLTSTRNVDFVREIGLYQEAVAYDALSQDLPRRRTVVVDMAGNGEVTSGIRERLGEDLAFTIHVGITHWKDRAGVGSNSRSDPAKRENFFVPTYVVELSKELGPAELRRRSRTFLRSAVAATSAWMSVRHCAGLSELAEVYEELCAGTLPPSTGVVAVM